MKRLLSALLMGVAISAQAAFTPTEDGLYARFTTSMGEFTAQLEMEAVPLTVANFIGLAEGSKTWMDLEAEVLVRAPFYEGITFHRVIDGFMIQAGSRNGLGTDGPGYRFADDMRPDLTHVAEGILSMANSGPNTNGSQFFITLGATPWLDGNHSVFGRIVDGMATVQAIGDVPTNSANAPLDPVLIQSIDILRVGAQAEAFSSNNWTKAGVVAGKPSFAVSGGQVYVREKLEDDRTTSLYQSSDLVTWTSLPWPPEANDLDPHFLSYPVTDSSAPFFRSITFINAETENRSGDNLRISLEGIEPIELFLLSPDEGGTYTFDTRTDEPILGYRWYPLGENRYQLHISMNGLFDMQMYFTITHNEGGTAFVRVLNPDNPFNLEGTFSFF